jgi:uncharacterized protein YgiM (DUF1202 family)
MKKYILILCYLFIALTINAQTNYKYTSANLNLRTEPNTSSKVVIVIPKGTQVKMAEICDCEWILVSYDGNNGYVYSKYLTVNKIVNVNSAYSKPSNLNVKHYTNSLGERVQSPTYYNTAPAGATALCRDGTYSFSKNRRGTCTHHGGVAKWLR